METLLIILITDSKETQEHFSELLKSTNYNLVIPEKANDLSDYINVWDNEIQFIIFWESDKKGMFDNKIVEILANNKLKYLNISVKEETDDYKRLRNLINRSFSNDTSKVFKIDKKYIKFSDVSIGTINEFKNEFILIMEAIDVDKFLERGKNFYHDDINDLKPYVVSSLKSLLVIDDDFFNKVFRDSIKEATGYNRAVKSLTYSLDGDGKANGYNTLNLTGAYLIIMALFRSKFKDNLSDFHKIFGDKATIKNIENLPDSSLFFIDKDPSADKNLEKTKLFVKFIKEILVNNKKDNPLYNQNNLKKVKRGDNFLEITVNFEFEYYTTNIGETNNALKAMIKAFEYKKDTSLSIPTWIVENRSRTIGIEFSYEVTGSETIFKFQYSD